VTGHRRTGFSTAIELRPCFRTAMSHKRHAGRDSPGRKRSAAGNIHPNDSSYPNISSTGGIHPDDDMARNVVQSQQAAATPSRGEYQRAHECENCSKTTAAVSHVMPNTPRWDTKPHTNRHYCARSAKRSDSPQQRKPSNKRSSNATPTPFNHQLQSLSTNAAQPKRSRALTRTRVRHHRNNDPHRQPRFAARGVSMPRSRQRLT